MTVNERFIALIRTVVPYLWSAAIVWLIGRFPIAADVIAWLNDFSNQDVTVALGLLFTGLVLAGYYWVARWAGAKWPVLERWLIGRSIVPSYTWLTERELEADYQARHARDSIADAKRQGTVVNLSINGSGDDIAKSITDALRAATKSGQIPGAL